MTARPSRLPLRLAAVLVIALGAFSVWAAVAPPTSTTATTAKLQRRIDLLLKRRIKTEALPLDLPNPFQVNNGTGIAREAFSGDALGRGLKEDDATGTAQSAAAAGPSNVDILSSIVSRLRFGGMIVQKDQGIKVVINGVQRKEGEMVPAEWNNTVVYLKITKVTSTEVSLRYNDADASLKF